MTGDEMTWDIEWAVYGLQISHEKHAFDEGEVVYIVEHDQYKTTPMDEPLPRGETYATVEVGSEQPLTRGEDDPEV